MKAFIMSNNIETAILEILNAKTSADERKAALQQIEIKGGCDRSYREEEEPWPACYPYPRKRGIVEYSNCEDPSQNRTIYGDWHCKDF